MMSMNSFPKKLYLLSTLLMAETNSSGVIVYSSIDLSLVICLKVDCLKYDDKVYFVKFLLNCLLPILIYASLSSQP